MTYPKGVIRTSPLCKHCGSTRTHHQVSSGKNVGRWYWYCATCATEKSRKWRAENPQKYKETGRRSVAKERQKDKDDPKRIRARTLWKKYRLTLEQYETMIAAQEGACATCGTDSPGGPGGILHVDHDHSCCPGGKTCGRCIRGLLCDRCNKALGYVDDDVDTLMNLASYLQTHSREDN